MTPEQGNRFNPKTLAQMTSSHAQSIVDNLRNAVKGGAIAAQYNEGEYQIYPNHVVDKDGFEENVRIYTNHLLVRGVDRKSVRVNARTIRDRFHAGTAAQQYHISTNLLEAVDGLSRTITGIR